MFCMYLVLIVFFFKQKTAYEMRISDWSSDVCSSDLADPPLAGAVAGGGDDYELLFTARAGDSPRIAAVAAETGVAITRIGVTSSEERRVGKAGVSTCSSRWSPYH